jgi:hypothetical protein
MSEVEKIREGICGAAAARAEADEAKSKATADLVRWLQRAEAAGISHSEAARLAGLTRNGAYHLLGRL